MDSANRTSITRPPYFGRKDIPKRGVPWQRSNFIIQNKINTLSGLLILKTPEEVDSSNCESSKVKKPSYYQQKPNQEQLMRLQGQSKRWITREPRITLQSQPRIQELLKKQPYTQCFPLQHTPTDKMIEILRDKPEYTCKELAELQVEKLQERDLRLYSSFGVEYLYQGVVDVSSSITKNNELFEKFNEAFKQANVQPKFNIQRETIMNIHRLKVLCKPQRGLQVAELASEFRKISDKILKETNGLTMTATSGFITFSLWNIQGENMFCDEEGKLSDLGRKFLSGLCAHASSLGTLSGISAQESYFKSPNPYGAFRIKPVGKFSIKTSSSSGPYIEISFPGSFSDPYCLLAGALIAGMDGIDRKLDSLALPPEINFDCCGYTLSPYTPSEVLSALYTDCTMMKTMSPQLIRSLLQQNL